MELRKDCENSYLLAVPALGSNKVDAGLQTHQGAFLSSQTSLIEDDLTTKSSSVTIYKRRYYILFTFSLMACVQGVIWNTWGPISQSAKRVFDWTDGDIALLTNWGTITFCLSMPFFSWLLQTKGLRLPCLMSITLMLLGAGIRCATAFLQQPWDSRIIHVGQILSGFGGPVAMAAGPVVSSHWFPQNQRTTATSVATMGNVVGVAISLIIGPFVVPERSAKSSGSRVTNDSLLKHNIHINDTEETLLGLEREDIIKLMYIEFAMAGLVFLAIIFYFPSQPPTSPSLSASAERVNYMEGLVTLVQNVHFLMIATTFGLCLGLAGMWTSILSVNISSYGVSEAQAGWMGFYSMMTGAVGAIIVAKLTDYLMRHMKLYIIILFVLAGVVYLWLALMVSHLVPIRIEFIYISVIFGGFCLNSATPLLFELACEITYPVFEAASSGALTLSFNITAVIFLSFMMIPNIGVAWTFWCLPICIGIGILFLLLVKQRLTRLNMDLENSNELHRFKSK